MDSAQLLALAGALRGKTVAVIGDVVADEFVYGRVARVSREAPPGLREPDAILNNLMEAVGWILRSSSPLSAR